MKDHGVQREFEDVRKVTARMQSGRRERSDLGQMGE